MNKEKFETTFKPFLVLVGICVVVTLLLAFTNSITAPVIAKNKAEAEEKTRQSVLAGATAFSQVSCDTESLGVQSVYKDDGGAGYVITAVEKGYKGDVTVTVGVDGSGKIVGLNADVSTETTGVGSRAGGSAYIQKFIGLSGSADSVDTISGATYSSTAVKKGVAAALKAFDAVKGA